MFTFNLYKNSVFRNIFYDFKFIKKIKIRVHFATINLFVRMRFVSNTQIKTFIEITQIEVETFLFFERTQIET